MGGLQPWHWLIVIAVFVLLFGAKKLPDAARSLGKSMRIFKSEIKEMRDEDAPAAAPVKRETPPAAPPALETRPATTDEAPARAPEPEVRER